MCGQLPFNLVAPKLIFIATWYYYTVNIAIQVARTTQKRGGIPILILHISHPRQRMKNRPNINPNLIWVTIGHHIPTAITINTEKIKIDGTVRPKMSMKIEVLLERGDTTKMPIKQLTKTLKR